MVANPLRQHIKIIHFISPTPFNIATVQHHVLNAKGPQ
jgi:hypothetical protein